MRWSLIVLAACGSPPPAKPALAPACEAVGKHVLGLLEPNDDHAKRVREIFTMRCEHDAWNVDTRSCVLATTSLKDPKHCKAKLSVDQRASLERDLDEADRGVRTGTSKLPAACAAYKAIIDKIVACDKLPESAREALKDGFENMAASWSNVDTMPDDVRRATEESCKAAADAMTVAVKDICSL